MMKLHIIILKLIKLFKELNSFWLVLILNYFNLIYFVCICWFLLFLFQFLGDEIIDYIMLLVTTKKTTAELAKSIDFVMENNTDVFVKWLSTVIKSLQQVTVSTTKNDVSSNSIHLL